MTLPSLEELPGWFTWPDIYRRWARDATPRNGVIVEVGVHYGRSLQFLVDEILRNVSASHECDYWFHAPTVFGVDKWDDESISASAVKRFRHVPFCMLRRSTSVHASRLFRDKSVEYVWLDADHSYAEVKKDIEAWWPKVTREMGGHDYSLPGVQRAVKEFVRREGLTLELYPSPDPEMQTDSWLVRR